MFESLDPPADLGAARARLQAMADARAAGRPVCHLPRLPAPVDPAAAVVVVDAVLWSAAWEDLGGLAERLDHDQALLFLEPTADLGWRRTVQRLGRPLWRRMVGHHFGRDIPASLRAVGLDVTELTRFGVGPRDVWSYALGQAEHIRRRA